MENQKPRRFYRTIVVRNSSLQEAEDQAVAFLKNLGFEILDDGKSYHKIFKKDDLTVELYYNANDGSCDFCVVPTEKGPSIYNQILVNTSFISDTEFHLTHSEFWKNTEGVISFRGEVHDIIRRFVAAGF